MFPFTIAWLICVHRACANEMFVCKAKEGCHIRIMKFEILKMGKKYNRNLQDYLKS
jgi:hypothetical protein